MSNAAGILEELEGRFREEERRYLSPEDAERVEAALEFSRNAHEGQKRLSGEPYVTHCISVAMILMDLLRRRSDPVILQAALLHDVLEDNLSITYQDIADRFGEEVAQLVEGVTKIGGIPFRNPEAEQSENFRKMLLSMARDIRVILVKLADRLHNMRTLESLKPQRRVEISEETREIYAPLAHRLGIARFKWELEDLAFKFIEPEQYRKIADLIATKRGERERSIEEMRGPLRSRLEADGVQAEVTGRAKSFYSIWGKMTRHGTTLDEMHDLLGVRVITESKGDCYRVLGVVHDLYVPVQDRFKDYIATPKSNMYQSLHTTVIGPQQRMVEIQIRTREMHLVSEIGIAAHYRYKEGGRWDEEIERKLGEVLVRRTTEWHEEAEDPKEFMDFLKISLYQDEVFVFTPRGELRQLPRGATPIDFAYAIHSQVGNRCVGARVNGRIVPLRYELKSGDTVEIMTSTQASPSEDWLHVARSSRARAKIRQWIKAQRVQESILLGREMLQRELRKKHKKFPNDDELMDVAQSFGLSDVPLLYAKMGEGNLALPGVLQKLYPDLATPRSPSPVDRLREVVSLPVKGISIQNVSSLLVHLAQCCHPVPGDAVVGIVTRGRGVSVHRQDCPNTFDDRVEKERKIDVNWDVEGQKMFHVRLAVYGNDRSNLLADVATAISGTSTNIKEGGMASVDAQAVGDFLIEVKNLAHLDRVMRAIRGVKGVSDVERKQHLPREFGEDPGRHG